ncbi:hypothetical protein ACQJBY_047155 [Aegilops geniculata]
MDRKTSTSHTDILERLLLDESAEPTDLPLSLLKDITNGFSPGNKIGSGGYAVVYKGVVRKGMVAVKKLSNTFGIHENKFQEEVKCLIKAKHKNIVRFLGYCADTQDATCGLNWMERYRIIRGVCEGLLFLHEKRILHLDLKPTNILLDGHMVPKIADFGLSRCLGEEQTRSITQNLWGTLGYMDPEYIRSRQITHASDMYSLGVIIMEILTGVRQYLKDEHVVQSWMIRLKASEGGMQLEQVRVCYKIAIECMDLDPKKRPVARHIVNRLDKTTSAEYLDETSIGSSLFELQTSLPREQSGERIGKHASESLQVDTGEGQQKLDQLPLQGVQAPLREIGKLASESRLQKADVEEHLEILVDVPENLGRLHYDGDQKRVGQLSLWGGQNTTEKVNCHGASNSSSTSAGFNELNILGIDNRKAHMIFNRNNRRTLEQSHFLNIFRKEELKPILRSSNLIRESGSTKVYKGVVDNTMVAVKKTFNAQNKQLEKEVIIQSQIIHKNIACLIGCCLEMDSPILVYEFLSRGSLHDIIHSGNKVPLNLDVRLNIIAETAQGLAYLHSQARTKIVHGDVKPASILLGENFIPNISGFGTSRLIERDGQHTRLIINDKTYMDPVYLQTGLLTEKSDVYSFGIVILELISRKKATHTDDVWLVRSFIEVHKEGKKATELFDKEIAVTTRDLELLDCLTKIAVECLNLDVDERPTMTDIAERLVRLNRSYRLHARHISADYSEEVEIRSSFVVHRKVGHLPLQGMQDMNYRGTSNSSSVSTGFYKLNNLDIFNWKSQRNFNRNNMHILEKSHFIKIFTNEELKSILRNRNFIGEGSFAVIYRCVIDNSLVTVKKLINNNEREIKNLENEVLIHSQVSHRNIVRLIGCSLEMDTRMLVYELLPRRSLDDILHNGSMVPPNLDVRLNIVAESAQGLAYLHSQARTRILHGNVKPASILLDDDSTPKISGLGLSRLIVRDKEHTSVVIGDMAYMDPLYMQTGLLTLKSDVYSFGVVILEIISGKKPRHSDKKSIVRSFIEVHKEGKKATDLFDKEIAVTTGDLELLDCLTKIAVECLNLDVDQRPTMIDVAERLLILNRSRRSKVIFQ